MKKFFALVQIILLACVAYAQDVYVEPIKVDSFYYEFDNVNLTAKIVKWQEKYYSVNHVTLPDTVTYQGVKYVVNEIGPGAFCNNVYLHGITIPNTIRIIGGSAFAGTSIKDLYIPSNVDSIGGSLFGYAMYGNPIQRVIKVATDNTRYDSRNNCNAIIETSSNKLICGCRKTRIPNGVKEIGSHAFEYTEYLEEIDIPNSVEIIGESAFAYCKALRKINFGTGLKRINQEAFYGTYVTQLELFDNIERIDSLAFSSNVNVGPLLNEGIICHSQIPPQINCSTFQSVSKNIPIYVPTGSINLYNADAEWAKFNNIVSIDELQQKSTVSSYAGRLDSIFSVSSTKKVVFSVGNLQYNYNISSWRLASHQYENLSMPASYEEGYAYQDWAELFARSTNANYYGIVNATKSSCQTGTYVDWGNVFGADWRVLTTSEWHYIIFERDNAASLYGFASINGINGCILLPDNWQGSTEVSFNPGVSFQASLSSTFRNHNNYTLEEWRALEELGAVFLPALGYSNRASNGYGYYWGVSNSGWTYPQVLLFYPDIIEVNHGSSQTNNSVSDRFAVRLVHDYKFYSIIIASDGNGMVLIDKQEAMAGDTLHYTIVPNEHYRFKEWEIVSGNIGITDSCLVMYAEPVEIKADFEYVETYPITIIDSEGGLATADKEEAEEGTLVTLSIFPNESYMFEGWNIIQGDITISNNSFVMPNSGVILQPIFVNQGTSLEQTSIQVRNSSKILKGTNVYIVNQEGKVYQIDGKSEL